MGRGYRNAGVLEHAEAAEYAAELGPGAATASSRVLGGRTASRAVAFVRAHPLISLTIAALAVRLVWFAIHSAGTSDPIQLGGGDGLGYWVLGDHLSHQLDFDHYRFLFRPPGYPAAIAAGLLATPGSSEWVPVGISMLASVATVPLTYALGAGLGLRKGLALGAAAIMLVEPTSVRLAGTPLADSLFALLIVAATVLALKALGDDRTALRWAALAAIVSALAALTKPIGLGFAVVLAGVLVFGRRPHLSWRRLAAAALVLAVSAVTYIAWTDTNERNFGVPEFSSQGKWNLYFQMGAGITRRVDGLSPEAAQQQLADRLSVELGAQPSPTRNLYFYSHTTDRRTVDLMGDRGLQIVRRHPAQFLKLYPVGAAHLLFNPLDSEIPRAPYLGFLLLLYAAAGIGLVTLWRARQRLAAVVIVAVAAYVVILTTTTLTAGTTRLFLPALPFLAVAAAAGVGAASRRLRARAPR